MRRPAVLTAAGVLAAGVLLVSCPPVAAGLFAGAAPLTASSMQPGVAQVPVPNWTVLANGVAGLFPVANMRDPTQAQQLLSGYYSGMGAVRSYVASVQPSKNVTLYVCENDAWKWAGDFQDYNAAAAVAQMYSQMGEIYSLVSYDSTYTCNGKPCPQPCPAVTPPPPPLLCETALYAPPCPCSCPASPPCPRKCHRLGCRR